MKQAEDSTNEINRLVPILRKYWKFLLVALLWTLCLILHYLPISAGAIETYYSKGLYRVIAGSVTTLTGAVPFSIILVILAVAPIVFILCWGGIWIYRRRNLGQPHWKGAIWGGKSIMVILPVIWLWFLLFWGMGYQRQPIESRLGFDLSAITDDEVHHLEKNLLAIILRDQPGQESDRNTALAIESISNAMRQVVLEWDGTAIRIPKRVKSTPPGLFLMNGTSGMCVPLTLEPHVDGGLPDTAFVSVAAHELGHIAGLCDEGETNLLSYVAGLRADSPYARYAVALRLYRSISGRDKKALERLPEQALNDLKRASEASQHYRIDWLQQWSWRAYNQYLKAQGVKDGVESYSRGTQLIVYAWRSGHVPFPKLSSNAAN